MVKMWPALLWAVVIHYLRMIQGQIHVCVQIIVGWFHPSVFDLCWQQFRKVTVPFNRYRRTNNSAASKMTTDTNAIVTMLRVDKTRPPGCYLKWTGIVMVVECSFAMVSLSATCNWTFTVECVGDLSLPKVALG